MSQVIAFGASPSLLSFNNFFLRYGSKVYDVEWFEQIWCSYVRVPQVHL